MAAALLALCGCANDSHIKPPKIEHEYVLPPPNDSRFSNPPQFPSNSLNQGPKKPSGDSSPAGAPGGGRMPGRFGAGGRGI